MISTDFAPNEQAGDAMASLAALCQPGQWKEGEYRQMARKGVEELFPGSKATMFLSGRTALTAVLKAAGVGDGEVIVAGFTCEAVVLPILHLGLTPVYADIEKETFSLDPASVEERLTGRTRAIVLQHTFGLVPKWRNRVLQLASQKNILIIEDLAHGFEPSFWQKQHLADKQVLLLSFGRSKALSSVFGGAAVTADRQIAAEIELAEEKMPYPEMALIAKLLCYKPVTWVAKKSYNFLSLGKALHFLGKKSGLLVAEISGKEKAGEYDPYLEKKYPNALAKLLVLQLKRYAGMVGQRRRATAVYKKYFRLSSQSIPTRFPVLVEERDATLNDVSRKGIYLGSWYTQPVAPRQLQLPRVGYTMGSCPTAESVCRRILNLPTLISEKQAATVAQTIRI